MSHLYRKVFKQKKYFDRQLCRNYDEWLKVIQYSKTVYVGNLSIFTTEKQIYEHMSKVGQIEKIIMGLHRKEKTPCGFCFVVYKCRNSYEEAVNILNNTILDGRIITIDEDLGIIGDRKYGRGKTGAQRSDERLVHFDAERPMVFNNPLHKTNLNTDIYENNMIFNRNNKNRNNYNKKKFHNMNPKKLPDYTLNINKKKKSVHLKPAVNLYPNYQNRMEYNNKKKGNFNNAYNNKRVYNNDE